MADALALLASLWGLGGLLPVELPPLEQRLRFAPCRAAVRRALDDNRALRDRLAVTRALYPARAAEIDAACDALDERFRLWDLLDDAWIDALGVDWSRRRLQRLREAVGEEPFWAGVMPDPVPVELLRRLP